MVQSLPSHQPAVVVRIMELHEHRSDSPIKPFLPIFGLNLFVVDFVDLCRGRTHLQVLQKFVKRISAALSFAGDSPVVVVLRMTGDAQAVGLLDGEGAVTLLSVVHRNR